MLLIGKTVGIDKMRIHTSQFLRTLVHDITEILPGRPRDMFRHCKRDLIRRTDQNRIQTFLHGQLLSRLDGDMVASGVDIMYRIIGEIHDIFYRELISNGCDAVTKLKKLDMMGEYSLPEGYKGRVDVIVDPEKYNILLEGRDPGEFRKHVAVQAQIELGFERFLEEKNYQAIVTHFGDLGALKQLPGLAIQRLMEKGYGFGAEGDWKVAAMVRLMKIMTGGVKDAKGTSMLEDYTYNLVKGKEGILEAHMLEI